jgi:hypothetical protein
MPTNADQSAVRRRGVGRSRSRRVERTVSAKDNDAYRAAIERLAHVATLMTAARQAESFRPYVADVRARQKSFAVHTNEDRGTPIAARPSSSSSESWGETMIEATGSDVIRELLSKNRDQLLAVASEFTDDPETAVKEAEARFETMMPTMAYVDNPTHPMAPAVFVWTRRSRCTSSCASAVSTSTTSAAG